jgi:tRNA(fMet)-specific endonuclease VapC
VKYLLDSDHLSILQRPSGAEYLILSSRMDQHAAMDFAASVVSFHEQSVGCHARLNQAKRPDDLIRSYQLLQAVLEAYAASTVLPFDAAAAAALDGFKGLRLRCGIMDRRIAAIAVCRKLVLLTRNTSDFSGIPSLVIEDWTV